MGWLQDESEKWGKVAEATKPLLEMPEANLDESDPESLLSDQDEQTDHFEEMANILRPVSLTDDKIQDAIKNIDFAALRIEKITSTL